MDKLELIRQTIMHRLLNAADEVKDWCNQNGYDNTTSFLVGEWSALSEILIEIDKIIKGE